MYKLDGIAPVRTAALPLSHLQNQVRMGLCGIEQDIAFLQCVGERFFEIQMFAGFQRVNPLQAVPVVGCTDNHKVDVWIFEEPAVVLVGCRLVAGHFLDLGGLSGDDTVIYITQRHTLHAIDFCERSGIREPHAIAANDTKVDLFVGGDKTVARGEDGRCNSERGSSCR